MLTLSTSRFAPAPHRFRSTVFCGLALLAALATPALAQTDAGSATDDYAPDRVLVRFREVPDARGPAAVLGALATAWHVEAIRPLVPPAPAASARARRAAHGLDRVFVLTVRPPVSVPDLVAALAAHPAVEHAEPDYRGEAAGRRGTSLVAEAARGGAVTPDDPLFVRQWSLHNTGANLSNVPLTAGADVNAPEAWGATTGSASVLVAVLDSGVRFSHPELAGRLWTNAADLPGNGLDDDGNGYVDDTNGWDFVNADANPADDNGHGANVTGIIAATGNNGVGYAGLDWQARVMTLKIFDANLSGYYSWWIAAVVYATDHGTRVLNLSGGGATDSQLLADAHAYAHSAGVVSAVAMMNFNNNVPYYPAAYETVIAVGATDGRDQRVAPFCWGGGSNWGPHIDLSAPGDYVYGLAHTSDTNYGVYWCGTSMAAPLVAGAASLLLAREPTLTPDAVRQRLMATAADAVGRPTEDVPGFDEHHGAGRLDVAALLGVVVAAEGDADAAAVSLTVGPNPAADRAVVTVALDAPQSVRVEVLDALGRRVARLHDGPLGAGRHALSLDAARLAPGVYAVRLVGSLAGLASTRLVVAR